MVTVRLISLFVCVFGAFAYGSAVVLWLRQASPVWAPYRSYARGARSRLDFVSLALFSVCTLWFVLNGLGEYRLLAGGSIAGYIELATLALVFAFPPLIMHTVYMETICEGTWATHHGVEAPARIWRLRP